MNKTAHLIGTHLFQNQNKGFVSVNGMEKPNLFKNLIIDQVSSILASMYYLD